MTGEGVAESDAARAVVTPIVWVYLGAILVQCSNDLLLVQDQFRSETDAQVRQAP
jgi:hypothetical protein